MVTFYFFGRAVESTFGSKRLLTLYMAGILGGVIFSNLSSGNTFLGSSAAVNAILTYYICNFPNGNLYLENSNDDIICSSRSSLGRWFNYLISELDIGS